VGGCTKFEARQRKEKGVTMEQRDRIRIKEKKKDGSSLIVPSPAAKCAEVTCFGLRGRMPIPGRRGKRFTDGQKQDYEHKKTKKKERQQRVRKRLTVPAHWPNVSGCTKMRHESRMLRNCRVVMTVANASAPNVRIVNEIRNWLKVAACGMTPA
jgi:hypothetical protein